MFFLINRQGDFFCLPKLSNQKNYVKTPPEDSYPKACR